MYDRHAMVISLELCIQKKCSFFIPVVVGELAGQLCLDPYATTKLVAPTVDQGHGDNEPE